MKKLLLTLIFFFSFNFTFAQVNWTREGSNPVLDVGPPGAFDDNLLLGGSVYFDGSTYHKWYTGGDGAQFRIGYATSPDGITWQKYNNNPVLDLGDPGTWDDNYVLLPSVIHFNSQYHMIYQGNDGEGQTNRLGHATSPDGINWTKDSLNPVLDVGPPGSWYDDWVATPFVVSDGDTLHLWFFGRHGTIGRIGHAFSTDEGTTWELNPNDPVLDIGTWDAPRVSSPSVVYNSITSEYYMIYSGGNEGYYDSEIGCATSQSLYGPWEKQFGGPIFFKGDPGEWDSEYVGFHHVIFDPSSNTYKMWYTGGAADWDGKIGLATSPVVLSVPGDYSTIQESIDAATDGNVVLVDEGTYVENINFKGKAITVASHFLVDGDTTHIVNTIIDGSQPSHPDTGAVVNFVNQEDTTSVLYGFTITGGTGTHHHIYNNRLGGGIVFIEAGGRVSNNIIENNSVIDDGTATGGGICVASIITPPLYNCIIENNIIRNNFVDGGWWSSAGGILAQMYGNVWIIGNQITNNTVYEGGLGYGTRGGGLFLVGWDSTSNYWVLDNIISNNTVELQTDGHGGGICIDNSDAILEGNVISDNSAPEGGGLSCVENSNPTITNSTIENNTATDGSGGGLNVIKSDLQIDGCLFKANDAYSTGGAISFSADTSYTGLPYQVTITNTSFLENTAYSRAGVFINNWGMTPLIIDVTIDKCEFLNNVSEYYTGLCVYNSRISVSKSVFSGNTAVRYTAAAGFSSGCIGTISNCLFASNIANSGGGNWNSGGLTVWGGSIIDIMNCTFADNTAAYGAGLTVGYGGTATTTNCIFWGNSIDQIALGTYNNIGGTLFVNYCDIEGGENSVNIVDPSLSTLNWGENNIDANPAFVDPLISDYHLQNSSPCIQTATDSVEVNGIMCYCPDNDIEGYPRPHPVGTAPDMGAYEYQLLVGIEENQTVIPNEYALYQNYPNPFNPATKINYQIPELSFVTIKVYDVLGNEIATLVNEEKTLGAYEITWYAEGLPSGIYLYQLKAGDFIETKKMLLLK